MSTYQTPTEPQVDTLWTRDAETGAPVRWNRVPAGLWARPGVDATGGLTWQDLLTRGPVHDQHPDLADVPPTPWALWPLDGEIRGADRSHVIGLSIPEDLAAAEFIVRAVNAYAEQLQAGD